MINIEIVKGSGTFVDSLYSIGVNIVQRTVINVSAVMKAKQQRFQQRSALAMNFQQQLQELGLIPERLWWGPMAFSPVHYQILIAEIESHPPKRLLEVGSGTSTAVFAALAEKYGFSVLSLENDANTIKYVQSILEGLPCSRRITIQKCGFIRRTYPNGEKYRWYDADLARAGGMFDFVFIDGPMSSLVGRNGALPEIIPYLSKDHIIYVDDIRRRHERLCLEEWKRHFPTLTFEECPESSWLGLLKV